MLLLQIGRKIAANSLLVANKLL